MPCWNILGIEICIPSLDDIINAVVKPITDFLTSSLTGLVSVLSPLLDNIISTLSPLFSGVIDAITNFVKDPLKAITDVSNSIWGSVSGLWANISSGLDSLWTSINAGISTLGASVSGAIDAVGSSLSGAVSAVGSSITGLINGTSVALSGAINTVGSSLGGAIQVAETALLTAFDGMGNAISGVIGGMFSGFGQIDSGAVGTDTLIIAHGVSSSLAAALERHSPMTPADAWGEVLNLRGVQRDYWYEGYIMALAIEGASLGQVDGPSTMLFQSPDVAAGIALATEWYKAPYEIAYTPLLERFWLKAYTPKIPAYQDLISIYVKEGYLADHWVELPAEMVENFKELGYSEDWTKRLWGKHWEYPSPTQLYEMLHRTAGNFPEIGVTSEILKEMLKLHDFEPKWRMPLEAISWNTWRIYDIRTGWEMDLLDDTGLVKRLIDTGYEPRDASLLAEIQKMFVLRSEIDGLLSESDTDFIGGWISEDQLKSDYEATPYNAGIRQLRVEKAKLRRERTDKADLKAALNNRFLKGDLSPEEYKQELSRLGLTQDRITIETEKILAQKLKTVKEDTATASKALTETTYSRSYRVGLIPEAEYRAKLAALKYSPEDIELLVELNTPEKPAPEELPTLTLGELKAAFRVGVLTENEFAAELDLRGYTPEDIETLIATEKAKIKPKAE